MLGGVFAFCVCVAVGRLQIETWCLTWHDNPFPRIAPRPRQRAIYVWVAVTCEGISAPSSRSALRVFFISSRCSSTENKLASDRLFLIRSQINSEQSERMKIFAKQNFNPASLGGGCARVEVTDRRRSLCCRCEKSPAVVPVSEGN